MQTLSQSQDLRQIQRLSPIQVRYVRMLEMSAPELEDEVHRALDEMPALQVADDTEGNNSETFNETAEQMQLADYRDDDIPSYKLEARNFGPDSETRQYVSANDDPSLYESLLAQLSELSLGSDIAAIAREIVGNLDTNGYLTRTVRQIADDMAINRGVEVSERQVEEALAAVRSLDPPGIGATDLRDSLLIQLSRLRRSAPGDRRLSLAYAIIEKYFNLLSLKHYDTLQERLQIDREQLRDALDLIRSLNPKPGALAGESTLAAQSGVIVPDATVDVDNSRISIQLDNNIPQLAIEQSFAADSLVPDGVPAAERDKALVFTRMHRNEAAMFIKSLSMRQQTLMNVIRAIVTLQKEFFLTGEESALRPMVLKDVAALAGYDLSTVSRATSGKYISTPAGVYPLKFFFNEKSPATRDASDGDVSSVHITAAIKSLIDGEDKSSPLTDLQITDLLKQQRLDVARRTVAKYRERLGYPVARLRKEL